MTAGRVIALAVEAAAQAGPRFGLDDLHAYRHQKDAELARERASTAAINVVGTSETPA